MSLEDDVTQLLFGVQRGASSIRPTATKIIELVEAATRQEPRPAAVEAVAWVIQRNDRPYQVFFDRTKALAICAAKQEEERQWYAENRHIADVRTYWRVCQTDQPSAAPAPAVSREEIARMINPGAFRDADGLIAWVKENRPERDGWELFAFMRVPLEEIQRTYATADAILSRLWGAVSREGDVDRLIKAAWAIAYGEDGQGVIKDLQAALRPFVKDHTHDQ